MGPPKIKKSKVKTSTHQHAHDHSAELKRLNRIKGQVEGIERMIHEHRYCPEIIQQVKATRSALRGLEASILEGHMKSCVTAALSSKDPFAIQEKIEEILSLTKTQD